MLRRVLLAGLIAFGIGFAASCASAQSVISPVGATQFDPPVEWKAYAAGVESCVRRMGFETRRTHEDFEDINWYWVETFEGGYKPEGVDALWREPNSIFLHLRLLAGSMAMLDRVVRHELTHWTRQVPGHPDLLFPVCST